MLKHITEPIPIIDTDRLGLPAGCNAVIAQALAKAPAARYATAGELARAVSRPSREYRPNRQPLLSSCATGSDQHPNHLRRPRSRCHWASSAWWLRDRS
jgi:hypothetical protein